jgi:hypothetical protein
VTWLLKLYPPRWRRRYGAELAEIVAAQPFSIGAAIDLIAGAIDAWLHPELIAPATPDSKGDTTMIARMLQLKCAGYGPEITMTDKVKSATLIIGGTLLLALVWLWAVSQFRRSGYVMALGPMTYFVPQLVGLRYTSLKGRSTRAQTIFIATLGGTLAAFFLLVEWIGTKI